MWFLMIYVVSFIIVMLFGKWTIKDKSDREKESDATAIVWISIIPIINTTLSIFFILVLLWSGIFYLLTGKFPKIIK